jgi:hypothetical protein
MKTQLAVLLSAVTFQACAGITINATRVVYSGKEKVASLNITIAAARLIKCRSGWTPDSMPRASACR